MFVSKVRLLHSHPFLTFLRRAIDLASSSGHGSATVLFLLGLTIPLFFLPFRPCPRTCCDLSLPLPCSFSLPLPSRPSSITFPYLGVTQSLQENTPRLGIPFYMSLMNSRFHEIV
ncbi:hypothetical protein MVEN_00141900 [Mycena venus]|uniref:Uncharacterized protein n=1 Tax=Mycena venus TaxID=2733690 RepID=A0A8H6YW69_9AGAR|nr:hypothetical protein MVEN_00141900 [Mycena venus]